MLWHFLPIFFLTTSVIDTQDKINNTALDRRERKLQERWNEYIKERTKALEFDPNLMSKSSIHVIEGKDIFISCGTSRRLTGGLKLSFLRVHDLNLISVGKNLHIPESLRFDVINGKDRPRMWTLRIRNSMLNDSGIYECQVNTEPQPIRHLFNVSVVQGSIRVVESTTDTTYVNSGSHLRLTCKVHAGPLRPKRITWYKDDRIIEYSREIEASIRSNQTSAESILQIEHVSEEDSGEYRCDTDLFGHEAIVKVFVVKSLQLGSQDDKTRNNSNKQINFSLATTISLVVVYSFPFNKSSF